ncbi:MAG: response regulator transcription factor [Myxococcota bacterium]|nr:response regulator transcription factor [Myxococcota bacterium]
MGARASQRAGSPADDRSARVLVIEDEEAIRQGLCDVLVYHGHVPEPSDRGDTGLERALSGEHDLVLLDVMLPGVDGFDICRRVRAVHPELPILMLTARGSEEDVLEGFRCGSDDYVTKPFSVAQLVARIEALLRRSQNGRPGEADFPCEDFRFGPWLVEVGDLRATCDGVQAVALSRREVDILALFSREAGRIVGRRTLLREIWGYPDPDRVETRSVDMQLVRLRRKLEGADIETVRGEGYRYRG